VISESVVLGVISRLSQTSFESLVSIGEVVEQLGTGIDPELPRRSMGRTLVIHADNARTHTARQCRAFWVENRLLLAVHPPYSYNLASSDFFLFWYVKHCLQGMVSPLHEAFLAAVGEIVAAIPERTHREYLTTQWRNSNQFLGRMVATVHKLNMANLHFSNSCHGPRCYT
jgi:hypothetical protein